MILVSYLCNFGIITKLQTLDANPKVEVGPTRHLLRWWLGEGSSDVVDTRKLYRIWLTYQWLIKNCLPQTGDWAIALKIISVMESVKSQGPPPLIMQWSQKVTVSGSHIPRLFLFHQHAATYTTYKELPIPM